MTAEEKSQKIADELPLNFKDKPIESREILPTCERMTDKWISSVEEHESDNQIVMYHKSLEAAEKQIETLQEENTRLKGLLKETWIDGFEKASISSRVVL